MSMRWLLAGMLFLPGIAAAHGRYYVQHGYYGKSG